MEKQSIVLKAIKYMIIISFKVVRIVFPPFDIFHINYVARKNGNKIQKLKPLSFKEYCDTVGGKITVIEEPGTRIVYEPDFFQAVVGKEYKFQSPDIYVAEIKDVEVHGGTGIVIADNYALTDIVSNDKEKRVKYTAGGIRRGNENYFYLEVSETSETVNIAINLCGLAASNYYHLTFEILSRYRYVYNLCSEEDAVVLLDEDAKKYPQYEELIQKVIGNTKIRYVPAYSKVHCKKLYYPSMNTWMPMNVRRKNDFRLSDNLVAYSAVENIRKATEDLRLGKADLKIFISRKNSEISRVANEKEVAKLFENAGFKVLCTEDLSYKEQVELFSSATCIIGASGAALTNLVYCAPGTVFGCIIPWKYSFCIYSSIAHMVGCSCLFLNARVTRVGSTISTERYTVDLDECKKYILQLEKMMHCND